MQTSRYLQLDTYACAVHLLPTKYEKTGFEMCWINSTQFPGKAARAGTGPGHFPALISLMDLNVGAGKAFYSRAVLSQNPVLGMPMAPGLAGC